MFDKSLIGKEMTSEEKRYEELKLLEETGYPETKTSLIRVNPELFGKFRYLTRIDVEEMFYKNQEYWQPVLLNLKMALAQDPYTNQEALTRKLMYTYFRSEGDDFVAKPQPQLAQQGQNPLGQMVQGNQMAQIANEI